MMKKYCGFALILICLLFAFCGCDGATLSPWGDKSAHNNRNEPKTYTIYVYGAVENEGYFEVAAGGTYFDAITQAGLLAQSWLPTNCYSIIDAKQLSVAVNYSQDDSKYDCINVNGASFVYRLETDGLPYEVVNKIADYLEAYGTIHNKTVLRSVLGENDYENYHYKLYVAEADYEKVH